MIYELARFEIVPGKEAEFEQGVAEAVALFQRAQGFLSLKLLRSIEHPSSFTLVNTWTALEDHTVHFRESEDFQEWRRLVGHLFASPPNVEHLNVINAIAM